MSRGRRYSRESKLNMKKVFAVIIAICVIIVTIIMLKKVLTKAKNTKSVDAINYFALYQEQKWGILGSNGEIVINPMYQEMPIVVDSSKDVFLCTYDINEEDGSYKTKAINKQNEEILTGYDLIEAIENFDDAENIWYEQNALRVQKDGKWGLISLDGSTLSEIIYDKIYALRGVQNSIIVEKDGKLGLMNSKGTKILDTVYSQILPYGNDYKNGYITVNDENKYGIVNLSGDIVLENKYQKIKNIYSEKYVVIEDGEEQLIDKQSNVILTEGYEEIKQIASSGIIFKKNNKFGLMDFEGNIVIDATYDELEEINTDVFKIKVDGKVGLIDKEKNEKVATVFTNIVYNKKASIYVADDENYKSSILNTNFEVKVVGILSEINTDDGYMKIKIDDEYKYYNFKFEEKNIKDLFIDNKLYVGKENSKYGFVDNKGNKVVDYIYDDATEINKYGFAAVKKDGLWGAIDKQGNVIIEPTYKLDENLVINFIGKYHLGLDLNMNYYCDK